MKRELVDKLMVNDGASYKTSLMGYDGKYYIEAFSNDSHLKEVDEDLSDGAASSDSRANREATPGRGRVGSSSSESSLNDVRCTSDSDEESEPLLMAVNEAEGVDKSVVIPYEPLAADCMKARSC